MNGDVLEEVRNRSMNDSEGSAQHELEIYLDSIDGRIQKLHNHIQELAATTVQSDWIKAFVSGIDKAIELITKLVGGVKSLNLAIGGVVGTVTGIMGKKLWSSDLKGDGMLGMPAAIRQLMKNGGVFNKDAILGTQTLDSNGVMAKALEISKPYETAAKTVQKEWGTLDIFISKLSTDEKQLFMEHAEEIANGQIKFTDIIRKDADGAIRVIDKDLQAAQDSVVTFTDKLKGLGGTFVRSLANIGIATAISFTVSLIAKGLKTIYDNTLGLRDKLIKLGDEAQQTLNEKFESIKEDAEKITDLSVSLNIDNAEVNTVKTNLTEIAKKYAELKRGVDQLTNANKNLTTDKYQQYLNISNEIGRQFPSLIKGYDDQGNKILTLSDNAQTASEQLSLMYQSAKELAEIDITENLNTAFDGLISKIKEAQDEIDKLNNKNTALTQDIQGYREFDDGSYSLMFADMGQLDAWRDNVKATLDASDKDFKEYIDKTYEYVKGFLEGPHEGKVETGALVDDFFIQNRDIILTAMSAAALTSSDIYYTNEHDSAIKQRNENNQQILVHQKEIDLAKKEAVQNVTKGLTENTLFMDTNNADITSAILANISQYGDTLINSIGEGKPFKEFSDWYQSYIIDTVSAIPDGTQQAIADLMKEDNTDKTLNEYNNYIANSMQRLAGNFSSRMIELLGFKDQKDKYLNMKNELFSTLGGDNGIGITNSFLNGLSLKELQKAYDLMVEKASDYIADYAKTGKSKFFVDLYAEPTVTTGSLKDVFSETFATQQESYEKNLDALVTAIQSAAQSGGKLIGDAQNTLFNAMKGTDAQFTNYDTTEIARAGMDQLNAYIDAIYKEAEAVDLDPAQMKGLETIIKGYIEKYSGLLTSADVSNAFAQNLIENGMFSKETLDEFNNEFQKELGDKEDLKILYSIVIDPKYADQTIDEYRAQFEQDKGYWQLQLDTTNFDHELAMSEQRLTSLAAANTALQKEAERNVSEGNYDTTDIIQSQITNLANQIAEKQFQRNGLFDPSNSKSVEARKRSGELIGQDAIDEATAEIENQAAAIDNEITEMQEEIKRHWEEIFLMPVTVLQGQETAQNLQGAYQTIVDDLGKYGEQTELDPALFTNFLDTANQIITNDQYKIDFLDAIINSDDKRYTAEFKKTAQEMRDTAKSELDKVNADLNTYVQKSDIGAIQVSIATKKAEKTLWQNTQAATGADMTLDDYTLLGGMNEAIAADYDRAIALVAQKTTELELAVDENLANMTPDQRQYYDSLVSLWHQLIQEQGEISKEIIENNTNMDLFPINELEAQASDFHTSVENTKKSLKAQDDTVVRQDQWENLIEQMQQDQTNELRLANMYQRLADSTPDFMKTTKRDYESKAEQHRGNAQAIYSDREENYAPLVRDYVALESKFREGQLAEDAEELAAALDNALHPLESEDYSPMLDKISSRMAELMIQEEHWLNQRDRFEIGSDDWKKYDAELETVRASMRSLNAEEQKYTQLRAKAGFNKIDTKIATSNTAIGRIQKQNELDTANNVDISGASYQALQQEQQTVIDTATIGMQTAMREITKLMGTQWRNNPQMITDALNKDFSSTAFEGLNVNLIAELVDLYNSYISQIQEGELSLEDIQRKQNENLSVSLENQLTSMQAATEGIQNNVDAIKAAGNQIDDSQYDELIDSYEGQVLVLKQLEAQYIALSEIYPDDPKYITDLNRVKGLMDQISQTELTLRTEQAEGKISNLTHDMTTLQQRYDTLNGNIASGQTTDEEGVYGELIDIANAQRLNKLSEAAIRDDMANMIMLANPETYETNKFYQQYTEEAEAARMEADKYVDTIKELRDALDDLPENRISKSIGLNEARNANLRSGISNRANSGVVITPDDYTDVLALDRNNIAFRNDYVNEKRNDLTKINDQIALITSKAGRDAVPKQLLDDQYQAQLDLYAAESELYKSQEQLAADQKAANEAVLAEYNEQMRVVNMERAAQENQKSVDEAMGKKRGYSAITADLRISEESYNDTKQQLEDLKLSDFIGIGETDEEIAESQQRQFDEAQAFLESELAKYETEMIKYQQEQDEYTSSELARRLDSYKNAATDLKSEMDALTEKGMQIPQSMLDEFERTSNDELVVIDLLRKEYERLAKVARDNNLEDLALKYEGLARGLDSDEAAANANLTFIDDTELNQNIAPLENKLNDLRRAAQGFENDLADSTKKVTEGTYRDLINNADSQIDQLRAEQDFYNDAIEDLKQELGDKFTEDNTDYLVLKGHIDSASDSITELINKQKQWNEAIRQLGIDETNRKLQQYNDNLKDIQNTVSLNEAKGIRKSLGDYQLEDKQLQNIMRDAQAQADDISKDFAFKIHWQIIEPGSEEAQTLQNQIRTFEEQAADAELKLAQNAHAEELLPITKLQAELDQLESVGNEIQRTFDAIEAAGNDVSDADYDRMTQNLESRRGVLNNMFDIYNQLYQNHRGDTFGEDMLKAMDDVNSKIAAIDNQELNIDLKIDNRALNNLQEDAGYIERTLASLRNGLDDAESTTMSREELLGAIIDEDRAYLDNLNGQAEEYTATMNKIKDENKDDYLNNDQYIAAATGLADVESKMAAVNKEIRDSKDAIDAIPIEKIDKIIQMYQTMAGNEESRRGLKQAQGNDLTSADFAGSITAAEGVVREQQAKRDEAYADFLEKQAALVFANANPTLRNREVAETDFNDAYTAYVEADTALNTAQTELAKTQAEASAADMQQFENRIALLNTMKSRIQAEREALEAAGFERGKTEILDDMGISREMSDALQAALNQLDAEYESGESGKTYLQYLQEREQLLSQMKAEEVALIDYQKELETIPMKAPEKALENLKKSGDEIDRIIASFRNVDKEVPDNVLADKLANIDAQKSQVSTIRSFYAGLVNTVGAVLGDNFVSGWKDKVAELDQQLVDLDAQAYSIGNEKDNKAFVHIGYQLDELKEKAKQTQKALEDTTTPESAEKYRAAIDGAIEQQALLTKQIELTRDQMADFTNENDPGYQQLRGQLRGLQDEYAALTESVHGWATALRDINLNHAIKGLEDYQKNLDKTIKNQDDRANLFGYTLTKEDYQERAKGYQTLADQAYNIAKTYSKRMAGAFNGSQDYQDNLAEYEKYMEQGRNFEFLSKNEALIAAAKAPIEALEIQMNDIKNKAETTRNEIEALVEAGGVGTAAQYQEMLGFNDAQIESIENQKKEWENYREFITDLLVANNVSIEGNPLIQAIDEAILKLDQDTRQLNKDTLEYNLMLNGGIELKGLQDAMVKLNQENTKLNDQITMDQSRNLMVYADSYAEMADNVAAQIENLKQSNEQLERQQATVGITTAKYNELEEQIQSNNSQINNLIQNYEEHNRQLIHFASNYANALQGAINTAINESAADTGLTNQAMESLLGQFRQLSEVAGMDLSNLFYNSAKGIKVNADELKKLVAIQSAAYSNSVANNIRRETDMISAQTNTIIANGQVSQAADSDMLVRHNKKMDALRNELSQYNAIMESIRQSTDSYAQWQQAEQSANPSARYDSIFDAMVNMEQRLHNGETNTDEFRQFVAMMSRGGFGTVDEFKSIYDTIARYFNNNTEGIENFRNDLVDNGFDLSGVLNIEDISRTFGLSETAITMIIDKLRDYGTNIITVTDSLDASAQMMDKNAEYQQLAAAYANALASGNQNYANAFIDQMATVRRELEALQNYTATMDNPIMTEEQYNAALNEISILSDKIKNTDNELTNSADQSRINTLQENIFGATSYEDYVSKATEYNEALVASMPNLFDITDEDIANYKSGLDQLREIAGAETVDFYQGITDETTFQELADNFKALHDIDINITENPAAKTALDTISKIIFNEGKLRLALDSTGMTLEQLNALSDDEISKVVNLSGDQLTEFIDFLHNKAGELPVDVTINQESIDNISTSIADAITESLAQPIEININTEGLASQINNAFDKAKPVLDLGMMIGKGVLEGASPSPFDVVDFLLSAKQAGYVDAVTSASKQKDMEMDEKWQKFQDNANEAIDKGAQVYKNISDTFDVIGLAKGIVTKAKSRTVGGVTESAFAHGTVEDGQLAQDTTALVNEVGQEGLIRGNSFQLIPGGMHMEKLKRGDIVLNHKQTEQLMETGKASGHGKVVGGMSAFANGTLEEEDIVALAAGTWKDKKIHAFAPGTDDEYWEFSGRSNRGAKEIFDNFATLIKTQNETFQDLSNSLKDYMSVSEKSNILMQEQNVLLEQVNTQRAAAEAYRTKAVTYEYQGPDKQTHYMDVLEEAAKREVNLSDYINGSRTIEELSTERPDDQDFVEAVKHYKDFTEQARNADRAVIDLNSQLDNIRGTIIQLPIDKMNESLRKLNNTMGAISAFTNVAQIGETAINNLSRALHDTFGTEGDSMFKPGANQLDTMVGLIDQNIAKLEETTRTYSEGLIETRANVANWKNEKVDVQRTLNQSAIDVANNVKNLSDEDIKNLQAGNKLTGIYDEHVQEYVSMYNESVDNLGNLINQINEGEKQADEELLKTQEAVANEASAKTNRAKDIAQAIEAYYGTFQSYYDSIGQLSRSQADYIAKYRGYEGNTAEIRQGYQGQLDQTNLEIANKQAEINRYIQERDAYEYGSIEWMQYESAINKLKGELVSLESAANDTYAAMANIPVQELQEKLKKIEDAYHGYSTALSSGVTSTASNINAYNRLMSQLGGPNALAGISGSTPYEMTNALIRRDVDRLKEEAVEAINAYNKALAELEVALASGDPERIKAAQDVVKETRNLMNDKTMEASVATVDQWQKQMETIDKYYQNIVSSIDTMINKLKINKQYLEIGNGYLVNGGNIEANINQQLAQVAAQRSAYAQSIPQMQAILNQGLASGDIQYGDEKWMNLNNMIMTTQNNMENLRLTELQLYEEMANVPNKVVEAKLKEIENAYHALTSVMSGNIAASLSQISVYRQLAGAVGQDVFAGMAPGATEIQYQDMLLTRDYQRAQEEANAAIAGYREAEARYWAGGTEEQIRLNKEAMDNARNLMNDKIAALATKKIDQLVQGIKNVETYWSNINGYVDSVISGLQTQNKILEARGVDKTSAEMVENYQQMIDKTNEQLTNLGNSYWEIFWRIEDGLRDGSIQYGDQLHVQLMTQLQNLSNESDNLRLKQVQLVSEMVEVPIKKAEKAIERIMNKYASLDAIISNNLADTLSGTMIYNQMAYATGLVGTGNINLISEDEVTYKRQNELLRLNTEKEQKILAERANAYYEARDNMNKFFATEEERAKAQEVLEKAEIEYINQNAKAAATRVNEIVQAFDNVQQYYDSMANYVRSMSDGIRSEREYKLEFLELPRDPYNENKIYDSYHEELGYIDEQVDITKASIEDMKRELNNGLANGTIQYGDELWRKLSSSIADATNSLTEFNRRHMELFKDMINLPMKQYEESLKNIGDAYSQLNSLINHSVSTSESAMRMYNQTYDMLWTHGMSIQSERAHFVPNIGKYMFGTPVMQNVPHGLNDREYANMEVSVEYEKNAADVMHSIYESNDTLYNSYDTFIDTKRRFDSMRATASKEELEAMEEELTTAQKNFYEDLAKNIEDHINAVSKLISNISDYYNTLNSYIDSLNKKVETNRNNMINYLGYTDNDETITSSFGESINNMLMEIDNLNYSTALRRGQLETSVKDGIIVEGDTQWKKYMNDILADEDKIEQLRGTVFNLTQELVSIPNKLIAEKINDISYAYNGLSAALSASVFNNTGSMRIYKEMVDALAPTDKIGDYIGFTGAKSNYVEGDRYKSDATSNSPTFVWQNQAALDDLLRQRAETAQKVQGALASQDIYNSLLKSGEYTQEQLEIAKNAAEEATKEAQNSMAQTSVAESKLVVQFVENIETYFTRLTGYIDTLNSNLETTRDYIIETSGYVDHLDTITKNYGSNVVNSLKNFMLMQKEAATINRQIQEGLDAGTITPGDDEYADLSDKLVKLNTSLVNTAKNIYNLYEGFYGLPSQVATEKIDNITKAFKTLEAAISNASTSTIANQRALRNLVQEYAKSNPYVNAKQFDYALGGIFGETFVGQNAALEAQLIEQRKKLEVSSEALKKAGDNLKKVQSGVSPIFENMTAEPTPIYEASGNAKLNKTKVEYKTNGIKRTGYQKSLISDNYIDIESLKTGKYTVDNRSYISKIGKNGSKKWGSVYYISTAETIDKNPDQFTGKYITKDDLQKLNAELDEYGDYNFTIGNFDAVVGQNEALKQSIKSTQEEINAAQDAFDAADNQFAKDVAETAAMEVRVAKERVANIDSYYNHLIQTQETLASRYESTMSVLQQLGRAMDKHGVLITDTEKVSDLYTNQVDALRSKLKLLSTSIVEQEAEMEKVKGTTAEDTEEYREMQNRVIQLRNEYDNTLISMDKLQDAMRHELYIKPIEEAIQRLETLRANFVAINGLIDDEGKITKEGDYTEQGILSLTFDMTSYNAALEQVEQTRREYEVMHERWLEDDSYSDEQYLADRQTAIEAIQKAMSNANASRQSIMTTIKNRYRTEIDYIKELIQAQSDELSKRKEMDDYDRNLKDKTKSVKQLESQLRALENINTLEAKAQRARLQEQLANARDDLDQTVQNHVVSMRQDALSELSKRLDKGYEEYVKNFAVNFDETISTVQTMEQNLIANRDAADQAMETLLNGYNTNLTTEMATGVTNVNTKLEELNAADLQSTAEMEKAKAEKLALYEADKKTALETLEKNQAERQKATDALINSFLTDEDAHDDTAESYLSTIEENSGSIKDYVSTISEHIDRNLSTIDSPESNIIMGIGNIQQTLNDTFVDYSDPNNRLFNAVNNILTEVGDAANYLETMQSDEYVEKIKDRVELNNTSLPTTQETVEKVNEKQDDYAYIDGVRYKLDSNGKYKTVRGSTSFKEDKIIQFPQYLLQGYDYLFDYYSGNNAVFKSKEYDLFTGLETGRWNYTSVPLEDLRLSGYGSSFYSGQHVVGKGNPGTLRESKYSTSDIINYSSLATGNYGIGGITKLNGTEYGVITDAETIDGNKTNLGKLIPLSALNIDILDESTVEAGHGKYYFNVGSWDKVGKVNSNVVTHQGITYYLAEDNEPELLLLSSNSDSDSGYRAVNKNGGAATLDDELILVDDNKLLPRANNDNKAEQRRDALDSSISKNQLNTQIKEYTANIEEIQALISDMKRKVTSDGSDLSGTLASYNLGLLNAKTSLNKLNDSYESKTQTEIGAQLNEVKLAIADYETRAKTLNEKYYKTSNAGNTGGINKGSTASKQEPIKPAASNGGTNKDSNNGVYKWTNPSGTYQLQANTTYQGITPYKYLKNVDTGKSYMIKEEYAKTLGFSNSGDTLKLAENATKGTKLTNTNAGTGGRTVAVVKNGSGSSSGSVGNNKGGSTGGNGTNKSGGTNKGSGTNKGGTTGSGSTGSDSANKDGTTGSGNVKTDLFKWPYPSGTYELTNHTNKQNGVWYRAVRDTSTLGEIYVKESDLNKLGFKTTGDKYKLTRNSATATKVTNSNTGSSYKGSTGGSSYKGFSGSGSSYKGSSHNDPLLASAEYVDSDDLLAKAEYVDSYTGSNKRNETLVLDNTPSKPVSKPVNKSINKPTSNTASNTNTKQPYSTYGMTLARTLAQNVKNAKKDVAEKDKIQKVIDAYKLNDEDNLYIGDVNKLAPNMDKRVLDTFKELGFAVVIDPDFKLGEGYFNAKKRTITLSDSPGKENNLYHELGHLAAFAAGNVDRSTEFKEIYNAEKDKFVGTYKAYGSGSPSEYFAECMREYINNKERLKQNTPRSYNFVVDTLAKLTPERIKEAQKTYYKIWQNYDSLADLHYASGTYSAKRGLARINENGPEIITTKKGTFVPFQGGEGVVPAKQTAALMHLAEGIASGDFKLQMPDMSAYKAPESRATINSNNDIHIDSLITINGNADATTVQQIREIAQQLINNRQFQENITQIVSKRQAADGRMAGKRAYIK